MKTIETLANFESLSIGSCWEIAHHINCFKTSSCCELATQAFEGRRFKVIQWSSKACSNSQSLKRIKICLLEDGYQCWIDFADIENKAFLSSPREANLLNSNEISNRLPKVIKWIENASKIKNRYLWGGTIGPNFDCSGLVQTSFASEGIWLPRDAYQQEKFCDHLEMNFDGFENLKVGDLLFFGTLGKCNHVGIYIGKGFYYHSSGITNGNDGIASNALDNNKNNPVAYYYRNQLRGAGRVSRCHDGKTLP